MKKINSILGFVATITAIVGVGSLVGEAISSVSSVYRKVLLGALGILLISCVIWIALNEPERW